MNAIYANSTHTQNIMTFCAPQYKAEYLTECLLEVLNNQWKVNGIESGHSVYTQLEMEIGRKYIKVWSYLVVGDERKSGRSCWMFVDKNTGAVYKPASYKAPAKGVRYLITQLADNPDICDPYGSFLYLR
tara:strand:- start:252 stop:641 length:390 start_codon:yes stop_codon:yes gene_type:complete